MLTIAETALDFLGVVDELIIENRQIDKQTQMKALTLVIVAI